MFFLQALLCFLHKRERLSMKHDSTDGEEGYGEVLTNTVLLLHAFCAHATPLAAPRNAWRSQFMGACILENGDTVILMELMLGGTLFEAIATDRVSWHNRCQPLCHPAGCQPPVSRWLTSCCLLATTPEGTHCQAILLSAMTAYDQAQALLGNSPRC